MSLLAALLLGSVIGLSLGALGGGGSILTVPALVYVLGEPARGATTASLVIVGVTSIVGAIGHARAGHVRWRAGLVFGLVGVAASYAGTAVNRLVEPNLLLLVFAGLMMVAAAAMLRRTRHPVARGDDEPPGPGPGTAPAGGTATATVTAARPTVAGRHALSTGTVVKVIGAGLAVGFLTGFLGVGGGFIVVPALVMALDFPMPVAVGTSLVVIAMNCAAALGARAGSETFHWAVIVPFTLAAIVGSLAGARASGRVSAAALTRALAGLLIAVGIYTAVRSGLGLF